MKTSTKHPEIGLEQVDEILRNWPEESREAAQTAIDSLGAPHEVSESALTWYSVGDWKRVVATRQFFQHDFPAPHTDSVESFIDFHVPVEKFTELAEFDGSVIAERTAGEVSARCHDIEANHLAINLMYDIVTGMKDVATAREYYAKEFLDARRKQPTPYMEKLRFDPTQEGKPSDPDERVLSESDLQRAIDEGKQQQAS